VRPSKEGYLVFRKKNCAGEEGKKGGANKKKGELFREKATRFRPPPRRNFPSHFGEKVDRNGGWEKGEKRRGEG